MNNAKRHPELTTRLSSALGAICCNTDTSIDYYTLEDDILRAIASLDASVARAVLAPLDWRFDPSKRPRIRSLPKANSSEVHSIVRSNQHVRKLLDVAERHAAYLGDRHIGTEHMLLAISETRPESVKTFLGDSLGPANIAARIRAYRPEMGWPDLALYDRSPLPINPIGHSWDTFLLHSLYNPYSVGELDPHLAQRPEEHRRNQPGTPIFDDISGVVHDLHRCNQAPEVPSTAVATLLRDLARATSISRVGSNLLYIYCVGCTAAEIEGAQAISNIDYPAIVRLCERYTRRSVANPPIGILLLGGGFDWRKMPQYARRVVGESKPAAGLAATAQRAILVSLNSHIPPTFTAVNGLIHLVLNSLTGGSAIPCVLEEGFALAMEPRFAYPIPSAVPDVWPSVEVPDQRRILPPDEYRPFDEVIQTEHESPEFDRHSALFYALHVFLGLINQRTHSLSGIIVRALDGCVASGVELRQWVVAQSGLGPDEIERRFERFCLGAL